MTTAELRQLLMNCADKLQRYRHEHSGEYIGGVEYTELQRRIVAALDAFPPEPQTTEKIVQLWNDIDTAMVKAGFVPMGGPKLIKR